MAFLRNGTIIKQDNPEKLVEQYNTQTLEEVFYILSQNQRKISIKDVVNDQEISSTSETQRDSDKSKFTIDCKRVSAILWKDWMMLKRNPVLWFIMIFIPMACLLTARYAFARTPKNIPMGVYNNDNNEYSQRFINMIDKEHIQLNFYPDNTTAIKSVVDGNNFIAVGFRPNFTDYFEYRFRDLNAITDEEVGYVGRGMVNGVGQAWPLGTDPRGVMTHIGRFFLVGGSGGSIYYEAIQKMFLALI